MRQPVRTYAQTNPFPPSPCHRLSRLADPFLPPTAWGNYWMAQRRRQVSTGGGGTNGRMGAHDERVIVRCGEGSDWTGCWRKSKAGQCIERQEDRGSSRSADDIHHVLRWYIRGSGRKAKYALSTFARWRHRILRLMKIKLICIFGTKRHWSLLELMQIGLDVLRCGCVLLMKCGHLY